MRDHYQGFDHPVLNISPEPRADLFTEMDQIADELRRDPRYVEGHLAIAFRQLQRRRQPDLSKAEFYDLFAVWRDRDHGQQVLDSAARAALWDALCDERELLFKVREMYPQHRAALTARLMEIGRALAEFQTPAPSQMQSECEWGEAGKF
jgi:hypothetical protein